MMIGIVFFSMLVIGVVEWGRAAVPVSGGSSGSGGKVTSGGSATSTNATTTGSQKSNATKKTVQTNAAGQGQSQSSNQGQSQSSNQSQSKTKTKTQTQQTTKKQVQKSKAKVTVRNTINAAQRGSRVRSVVASSRRPAIVRTRVSPNVGRSMRLTLRMRQPVARFTGGGSSPAINAHAHSRFERGTKKAKEGRGN